MAKEVEGEARGLLNPKTGEKKFQLSRLLPADDLTFFVEHYWLVKWDLRGQDPYVSENLTDPTVHLVVEDGQLRVYGVITRKFSRLIQDKGFAFGIKFRPGAFYPFVKTPVSQFTDHSTPAAEIFGADGIAFEAAILALEDEGQMVAVAEDFLRARLPERDANVALVNQIVETIAADGTILKVDDMVERLKVSKRGLQRLFHQYVGVSPKWVIQRYRLQEAAEKMAHGDVDSWPALALSLGYFDQAHFIKDFKAIVGKTPAEYMKDLS